MSWYIAHAIGLKKKKKPTGFDGSAQDISLRYRAKTGQNVILPNAMGSGLSNASKMNKGITYGGYKSQTAYKKNQQGKAGTKVGIQMGKQTAKKEMDSKQKKDAANTVISKVQSKNQSSGKKVIKKAKSSMYQSKKAATMGKKQAVTDQIKDKASKAAKAAIDVVSPPNYTAKQKKSVNSIGRNNTGAAGLVKPGLKVATSTAARQSEAERKKKSAKKRQSTR